MTALLDHLRTGSTTVCHAWVLERRDGRCLGFTDHDLPLTVAGTYCQPSSGLTGGAVQSSTGLAVDNLEVAGALHSDAITADDLRAGRWDDAQVTIWLVNWAAPEMRQIQFRGTLGEIGWTDEGAFSAELRGLTERLNAVRGRVYQGRCDAILGDSKCGVDLRAPILSVETAVTAIADDAVLHVDPLPEFAGGWFARGRIEMLDGAADGLSGRVKTDRIEDGARRVELWSAIRAPVAVGDRVRLEAGCDKRSETCRYKFANFVNFRGFPSIPGEDWLMAYPTRDGVNDGGRR